MRYFEGTNNCVFGQSGRGEPGFLAWGNHLNEAILGSEIAQFSNQAAGIFKAGIMSWTSNSNVRMTPTIVLFLLSLFPSVVIYKYFVEIRSGEQDVTSWLYRAFISDPVKVKVFAKKLPEDLSHESAYNSSVYYKIGWALEKEAKKGGFPDKIEVDVGGLNGAKENAFSVMNDTKSFGIVQDDTFREAGFVQDRVVEITPLFMERLHILYRCTEAEHDRCKLSISNYSKKTHPWRSGKSPAFVKVFDSLLKDGGQIGVGKAGSGGDLLLPKILHMAGVSQPSRDKLRYGTLGEMFNLLENETIDMAIFVTGTPNQKTVDFLTTERKSQFHLLGVDSVMVHEMNRYFDREYKATKFCKEYKGYETMPTLGVYATLIGTKDLTDSDKVAFFKLLNSAIEYHLQNVFTDPEIDVSGMAKMYEEKRKKEWSIIFKSFVLFVTSVGTTTLVIFALIMWFISSLCQSYFYNKMMVSYARATTLNQENGSEPNQSVIRLSEKMIDYNLESIKEIIALGKRIRRTYGRGFLTISHHDYLLANANSVLDWFKERLAQQLQFYINKVDAGDFNQSDFQARVESYLLDGYLSIENFEKVFEGLGRKG